MEMSRDALLLIHPTLGALGVMAALWVFVETFWIDRTAAIRRIRYASLAVAALVTAAWFAGGLWDAVFFPSDQEVLTKGPWVFVGNTAMQAKEHAVAILLLLALYLPIAVFRGGLPARPGSRLIVHSVSGLIVLLGLGMEGAGAALALSVRVGLAASAGGSP
jgi:hypothetical protein